VEVESIDALEKGKMVRAAGVEPARALPPNGF
jgi:hypothetical protein